MTTKAAISSANVQKQFRSLFPADSIFERLVSLAYSIPDFRRTGKGNHRHELGEIIILIIHARMSKCNGRADIIEFGKHYLNKLQSLGMLKNRVPSEPTL